MALHSFMRTLNLKVAFTTANNIITLFPPKQSFWLLGESWGVMNEGNHSTAAHHAQKMLFQFQDQLRWIMREKSIPTMDNEEQNSHTGSFLCFITIHLNDF